MLLVGILGSMLTAFVLYVSVETALAVEAGWSEQLPCDQTGIAADRFFPRRVEGTSLMVIALSGFDGPYIEDGSDREVLDAAALQVINTGSEVISRCEIDLHCGNGVLRFCGEQIPAGVPVVLLEQDATAFGTYEITCCTGWQAVVSDVFDASHLVAVDDRDMGTLVITNLSPNTLRNIRVYYKNWLSEPDLYMGGIAYSVLIPELKPGQTEHLYPYHYAKGYSKVVSICLES